MSQQPSNYAALAWHRFLAVTPDVTPLLGLSPQAVRNLGDGLISTWGLGQGLFTDRSRALVFTALAARLAEAPGAGAAPDRVSRGVLELISAVYGPQGAAGAARFPGDSAAAQAAYELVADPDASKELTARCRGPLLDDVRARLGITSGQEADFRVLVLDIPSDWPPGSPPRPAIVAAGRARDALRAIDPASFDLWMNRLQANRSMLEAAIAAPFPGTEARIEQIGGRPTILLPVFLAPALAADSSELERAYVHTQRPIGIPELGDLGAYLETVRADHVVGGRPGRELARSFLADLGVLGGLDVRGLLARHWMASDRYNFLADLAWHTGASAFVELVYLLPPEHEGAGAHARPDRGDVAALDGITRGLLDREIAVKGPAAVLANVRNYEARILTGLPHEVEMAEFFQERRERGLHLLADVVEHGLPGRRSDARRGPRRRKGATFLRASRPALRPGGTNEAAPTEGRPGSL